MIPILLKDVKKIARTFKSELNDQREAALKKLKNIKKNFSKNLNNNELIFLDKVIGLFEDKEILWKTPMQLNNIKNIIKEVPEPTPRKKGTKGRKPKSLTLHIQDSLGYKGLRTTFYPKYFKKIGIKACVYCNSLSTVSIDRTSNFENKETVKARFQVDHYYPKSKYPYLSISIFNLYPVCASCNLAKGNNALDFKLYAYTQKECEVSKYRFKLIGGSVVKYLTSKDAESIKVKFVDPIKGKSKKVVPESLQDSFDVQGIYNTQKDLAEELIIKAQVYTEDYKKNLVTSFPDLFSYSSLSNRILIGNYSEPKEIHKRPMSKFTQDIARQLGLID